jgi:methionyl-tRNA formyltransferase
MSVMVAKEDFRIVFMGTPEFAVASLDALVREKYNIAGVITAPDKPAGRGQKIMSSAVKNWAVKTRLSPILQPANLKDPAFLEELRSLKPDLQVVVAFRMLPETVWSLPPRGTINLHASLLPQYRGAAPINHVIINGEKETGVTTFFIRHEIDTGNIILQEKVRIQDNETAGELHDRLMHTGAELVIKTVKSIIDGTCLETSQSELIGLDTELKPAPKITTEDCRINWNNSAGAIFNFIRGLSPYPAAWSEWIQRNGQQFSIKIYFSAVEILSHHYKPGTLITDQKKFLKVACRDGFIHITDLQQSGKRRMGIIEFLRGHRNLKEFAVFIQ